MSRIIVFITLGGIILEFMACREIIKIPKILIPAIFSFLFIFARFGDYEIFNIIGCALVWLIYLISFFTKKNKIN